MDRVIVLCGACIAAVVAVFIFGPQAAPNFEVRFVAACEAEIQSRLVRRSVYQSVSIGSVHVSAARYQDSEGLTFPARLRQYRDNSRAPVIKELQDELRESFSYYEDPQLHEVALRYVGGQGLPVVSVCTFVSVDGAQLDDVTDAELARTLRVDGFSSLDWLFVRMRRGTRILRALN